MSRQHLTNYVVDSANRALGAATSSAHDQDTSDIHEALAEILAGVSLPSDVDYELRRESIAIAVCVRVLEQRGVPMTHERLERIGTEIARLRPAKA